MKPLTDGTTGYGVSLRSVAQSDVVNYLYGFSTQMSTLAPGIGDVYHFYADDITKNPGAIISFQIGFYAPALNSANSNIGFRTDVAAGPNNYGFFGGSAKNFMGWGATLINQREDNGVDKLQVNGSVSTAGLDNYTADISNTYTALSKISKGYANTNYLQNQTSTAQSASFNISGNDIIGGKLGIGTLNPDKN